MVVSDFPEFGLGKIMGSLRPRFRRRMCRQRNSSLRGQTMRIALRPYDPVDATERRRDERDLARLRSRLRRDCTEQSWRQHSPICRCRGQMAEPLAIVADYDGLLGALRQRAIELNTPLESIDEVAGLPTRYTTKLLGGVRGLGRVSLGPLLGALALKLVVMPDNDALARVRHRLPPRDASGRGPPLEVGSGVGLRKARTRQARLLAAALMRLKRKAPPLSGGASHSIAHKTGHLQR
jgi:hypothetical protein